MQVRIHSSSDTDFYLHIRSRPIIEHSQQLRFAPMAPATLLALQQAGGAVDASAGDGTSSSEDDTWRQVEDFGWVKATQSPNWSVVAPEARQPLDIAMQQQGGAQTTAFCLQDM